MGLPRYWIAIPEVSVASLVSHPDFENMSREYKNAQHVLNHEDNSFQKKIKI